MSGLQSTYLSPTNTRADFNRSDFEKLILEKGYRVIIEKSLQCPCKGGSTNQQSNCRNCGGSGWTFINPKLTRLVLQGMKITPNYKAWSEEISGDLQVTASDSEELTHMDRITVIDSNAIFNEVLHFKQKTVNSVTTTFAFTSYNIKDILYIGYFEGVNNAFRRLVFGTDYLYEKNIIRIINNTIVPVQGSISVTVRYKHAPQYLMVDMKRESMESWVMEGTEKLIHLPIAGTARRQHYILGASNLTADNIISNSYEVAESVPNVICGCEGYVSQQSISLPLTNSNNPIVIPFSNQTIINITHGLGRLATVTVYDENGFIVEAGVQAVNINSIEVTFGSLQSGTIIIQ